MVERVRRLLESRDERVFAVIAELSDATTCEHQDPSEIAVA
jgi:hypothetical protein